MKNVLRQPDREDIEGGNVALYLSTLKFAVFLTAGLFTSFPTQARIYDQREIAVAPGGVDVQRGMALTNHFWLQVVGPDIAAALVEYAQECAGAAIADGVAAARMTPSPEPSARINAGILAAQSTLRACAAVRPAIGYVVGQFTVQIGQQAEWTPNANIPSS